MATILLCTIIREMVIKFVQNNFLFFYILLLFTSSVQSRFITSSITSSSDGIHDGTGIQSILGNTPSEMEESCELPYGLLSCSTTVVGNLFHMAVYGYLMFLAAKCLAVGSEHLLHILGPGLVGGLFLPVIAALPDSLIILVSGLSGSREEAQTQVLVGMGLLSGSIVLLLTILWGSCVLVAKTDITDSASIDSVETKGFSLTGSGTSVDIWAKYGAWIMVASVLPYIIVQLPSALHISSRSRSSAVLVALIVAIVSLISYCIYQVGQPMIQERKLIFVTHRHVMAGALHRMHNHHEHGKLFHDDLTPNQEVIKQIFQKTDADQNGVLTKSELRALVIGLKLEELDLDHDNVVQSIVNEFDTNRDGHIDEREFVNGICKWLNKVHQAKRANGPSVNMLHEYNERARHERELVMGYQRANISERNENYYWVICKAVLILLLGVLIAASFAEPLVSTVNDFSTATGIPPFFISFILLPLVMNTSEATSALTFASQKTKYSSSLTFSEIYGSVSIHNLLCLSVFLAIVYVRDLTWNFSAEVLIITIVCIVMGLFASLRTLFPLWTCLLAYALYPFSLALVYVLNYYCGWT